jgi:hypothetical protein
MARLHSLNAPAGEIAASVPSRHRSRVVITNPLKGSIRPQDGSTDLSWREAKGKRAVNADEVRALYSVLWDEYIAVNPRLLSVLTNSTGLQDLFGQAGRACQATELWRIRCAALRVSA